MSEADEALLRDILEHGDEAVGYMQGVDQARFLSDRKLQLIIERLLEIVGEASGSLSDEARHAIAFDWPSVKGLRNILAHQYGHIQHDELYRTVRGSLPKLLFAVRAALGAGR